MFKLNLLPKLKKWDRTLQNMGCEREGPLLERRVGDPQMVVVIPHLKKINWNAARLKKNLWDQGTVPSVFV